MIGGKGWGKSGSSRSIFSYNGYSVLAREENSGTLGILPGGRKVKTLGDCSRCYVTIRICEVVSLEQREISLVGLPGRSFDAY